LSPRLLAFAAIVLWGLSFVATRVALREISPVTLVFARWVLGLALLLAIQAWQRKPLLPPRGSLGALALMGFIGVFFHHMLQSYALTTTSAIRTGWLIGLIPLWSALIAIVFLRERPGPLKLAGLAIGFAGAALIVTRGEVAANGLPMPTTRGDLLILASTLNWAIYTALGYVTIRRLGSLRATTGAIVFGLAMLAVPFVLLQGWNELPRLSTLGWSAVAFLGLGCSGLAYLFWYQALEKVDSTSVASFLYLEPLVTLAAAVPLLGEPVTALTVLGGVIVLAGVALVQRSSRPRAAKE
jgi:drug/metabolite transporter (DMT)-like permease